jgi:hypothetical protein
VIAQAIIAACPGFTSLLVQAGLPTIDTFTVDDATCAAALTALATRIGATWKATYQKDVRFGITSDPSQTDPTTLTAASALLTGLSAFSVTRDLSQVITQQPVQGGGSSAAIDVPAGSPTLPVGGASWYNPAGGLVQSGPQTISYTGYVGTGSAPPAAPGATVQAGGSVDPGVHAYAVVFTTPAGDSLPSPLATVVTLAAGSVNTLTPTYSSDVAGNIPIQKNWWAVTCVTALGETALIPAFVGLAINAAGSTRAYTLGLPLGAVGTLRRRLYRGTGATSPASFNLIAEIPDNTTGIYTDNSASPGGVAPATDTTQGQAVVLTLPIGPAGTTARKIVRTAAGASALQLLHTVLDNVNPSGTITANSIANPSVVTTPVAHGLVTGDVVLISGVVTSSPSINGTQTVTVLSPTTFSVLVNVTVAGTGGSFARIWLDTALDSTLGATASATDTSGLNVTLTGIPTSGAGSIRYPIAHGDAVNLRVVLNDAAAQTALAALLGGSDDGIVVGQLITGTFSETEARATGTAQLALQSQILVSVGFTTQDLNAHAGRHQGVSLAAPTSCTGTFQIQSVTSTNYQPALWPIRTVTGGSQLFTLQNLLRIAQTGA